MGGKKRTIFHEVIKNEEQYEEIVAKSENNGRIAIIDCFVDWCGPCMPMVPNYQGIFFNYDDPDNRLAFFHWAESNMSEEFKEKIAPMDIIPRFVIIANGKIATQIKGALYVDLINAIEKFIPEGPDD